MAIPDYEMLMLALLKFAGDGQEHRTREPLEPLATLTCLRMTKNALNASGQTTFFNRLQWAKTSLTQARLLEITRFGYFRITERGKELLRNPPARITSTFLNQYRNFVGSRQ
jgi:restriction system protein